MQYYPKRRLAFTMIELMIAIAILGVGLAMIAAIFPTAIKENQISFDHTIGTIICENGLDVATTMLKPTDFTSEIIVLADETHEGLIGRRSQHHPQGTDEADIDPDKKLQGFVVLGRKILMQASDGSWKETRSYHFVVVAYARKRRVDPATDLYPSVRAISTGVDIADWVIWDKELGEGVIIGSEFQNVPAGDLQKFFAFGTWVITSKGKFVKITDYNPDNGNPITDLHLTPGSNVTIWTVVQIEDGTGIIGENPIMEVFATRTGLLN